MEKKNKNKRTEIGLDAKTNQNMDIERDTIKKMHRNTLYFSQYPFFRFCVFFANDFKEKKCNYSVANDTNNSNKSKRQTQPFRECHGMKTH